MIQKSLMLILIILGVSCTGNDDGTQGTVNLRVGNCFDKLKNEVKICLDSVFNDSRCPIGLECVWEGDATAAFTLTKNENVSAFNLHANNKFQNDTVIDRITIKLLNITPYPIADRPFETADYKAEIIIKEN